MMKYESRCVHCDKPPCLRNSCPNYRVKAYYCDHCKNDTPAVYEFDGTHYCKDCLEKELDVQLCALPIEDKIELLVLDDEIMKV